MTLPLPPEPLSPGVTIHSITFDCADPGLLARFWSAALGWEVKRSEEDLASVVPPDGDRPRLLFLQVPEGKTVKNRMHLDLQAEDTMQAEVERLQGLGATMQEVFRFSPSDMFTVMLDPEGNEFCVESGPGDQA